MFIEWGMKYRMEKDNLEYEYNHRYYRTRYGEYMKLYQVYENEDRMKNIKKYQIEA